MEEQPEQLNQVVQLTGLMVFLLLMKIFVQLAAMKVLSLEPQTVVQPGLHKKAEQHNG